jgi:hypothetical protein
MHRLSSQFESQIKALRNEMLLLFCTICDGNLTHIQHEHHVCVSLGTNYFKHSAFSCDITVTDIVMTLTELRIAHQE